VRPLLHSLRVLGMKNRLFLTDSRRTAQQIASAAYATRDHALAGGRVCGYALALTLGWVRMIRPRRLGGSQAPITAKQSVSAAVVFFSPVLGRGMQRVLAVLASAW